MELKDLMRRAEFYEAVLDKELKPRFRAFVVERLDCLDKKIIELTLNK